MSRRLLIYASLGLFLGLFFWSAWAWPLDEAIRTYANPEFIQQQIAAFGFLAPLIYVGFYFLAAIMLWSTTMLTILGGLLFGGLWGSVYAIIAATLASQVAFLIARRISSDRIKKLKIVTPLIKKIESRLNKNGVLSIMTLRFLFVPYIGLSYASGTIPQLKGRDLFFGTLLSNFFLIPVFVYFGDALLNDPRILFVPFMIITLVVVFPRLMRLMKPLRKTGSFSATTPIPKAKK